MASALGAFRFRPLAGRLLVSPLVVSAYVRCGWALCWARSASVHYRRLAGPVRFRPLCGAVAGPCTLRNGLPRRSVRSLGRCAGSVRLAGRLLGSLLTWSAIRPLLLGGVLGLSALRPHCGAVGWAKRCIAFRPLAGAARNAHARMVRSSARWAVLWANCSPSPSACWASPWAISA